jgi:predicted DNA binding CopG/RHH family protein
MEEAPMMKKKTSTAPDLAKEAARFSTDKDFDRSGGWTATEPTDDVRDATTAISLRLPGRQLQILKEVARRQGIGYQTLLKRWLDERLREEVSSHRDGKTAAQRLADLSKELEWASHEVARAQR